ncbi:MAG: hypothetical protein EON95_08300 [Caulobacteraceae bacterium]|nr:MAG: hypothetical protein EON95_08300 [Caulobacteraceae bacterium]
MATTMLAWSGAASAATISASDLAEMGPGYSAADAPLGAPVELAIDLKGRVAARCNLTAPPTGLSSMALLRDGEDRSAFNIDCNTPFTLRVRSGNGGLASVEQSIGTALLMPYEMAVSVNTDSGRQDLGWCQSSELSGAASGCAYAPAAAGGGWSSGQATAIRQKGDLRIRWRDSGAPLFGAYQDTIIIELEVRS